MLFHNRPVKAAMGSVIVNGGVQLSGGKSLVNTKLVTLHFGLGEDKLADMNSGLSESESCFCSNNLHCGGPVNWFRSTILINWELAFAKGITGSKEEMEMRTSFMWPWLARMELKLGTQDCPVMREYLY